jgi:hypothetical protein
MGSINPGLWELEEKITWGSLRSRERSFREEPPKEEMPVRPTPHSSEPFDRYELQAIAFLRWLIYTSESPSSDAFIGQRTLPELIERTERFPSAQIETPGKPEDILEGVVRLFGAEHLKASNTDSGERGVWLMSLELQAAIFEKQAG